MNKDIREFQANLVGVLNAGQFPLELKRLVLAEILRKVEEASETAIIMETKEAENAESVQSD